MYDASPMTLATIWDDVGRRLRFRVRNIHTLHDYLILRIHNWAKSVRSKPAVLYAYSFQNQLHVYLECCIKDYALLSSRCEVELAARWKEEPLIFLVKEMYRKYDKPIYLYPPFGCENYD